ncbi:MAG: translation initiation factor IF-2 [Fimbriimonadaceae bacterium]
MNLSVAEFANKHKVTPGQVTGILDDLGIEVDGGMFEADDETIELIVEELGAFKDSKTLRMQHGRSPRDIAAALGKSDKEVLTTLVKKFRTMVTLTTTLEDDMAAKLVEEFGFKVEWAEAEKKSAPAKGKEAKKGGSEKRPPVVTILGHVDHGKTSLLDYIREANVVAKEFGGITQHIGAYQVVKDGNKITFLDTPGHAAFTAMRARGAQVTDIAILVVAADDGIMPQTQEAISHVKNAEVPIIVAINKIDKPAANPDKVMQSLMQYELVPEAYGGDVICCPVSAITGEGIERLLEMINLQADVMELTGDSQADLEAVVIEAKMEKGRGPVATLLVENGTISVGDIVIVNNTWGKIKAMTDHAGAAIKSAGPSTPVEILGLNEVPNAGDRAVCAENERSARDVVDGRLAKIRDKAMHNPKKRVTLRDIRKGLAVDETKDLNLIIRADVQGSVEAVRGLIEKIENDEVNVKVLHTGVGNITESDILLASASDAICVGFNVKPEPKAKTEADRQKIEIRTYNIIYELIEDIEAAVKGMLEPKFEDYHATIEVRAVF